MKHRTDLLQEELAEVIQSFESKIENLLGELMKSDDARNHWYDVAKRAHKNMREGNKPIIASLRAKVTEANNSRDHWHNMSCQQREETDKLNLKLDRQRNTIANYQRELAKLAAKEITKDCDSTGERRVRQRKFSVTEIGHNTLQLHVGALVVGQIESVKYGQVKFRQDSHALSTHSMDEIAGLTARLQRVRSQTMGVGLFCMQWSGKGS